MDTFLTILYWYLGLGVIAVILLAIYIVKEADKDMKPVTGEDLGMLLFCGLIWPMVIFLGLKKLFKEGVVIYDPKTKIQKQKEKEEFEIKKKSEALEDQLDVIKEETKDVPWYKR